LEGQQQRASLSGLAYDMVPYLIRSVQEEAYSRLLLHAIVHSAGIQDRDGGILLLATLFGQFPFLQKLFADSAYQGPISATRSLESCPVSKSKSSTDRTRRKGSCNYPSVGSLNAPSPGSTAAAGSPRLGKSQPQRPRLIHPPHAAKALQSMKKSWDGLLGIHANSHN
jgi:hypothetical protein